MAKESELGKRITNTVKSVDTLIHDIKTDVGHIIAAGAALKQTADELKDKFKPPNDKKEGDNGS